MRARTWTRIGALSVLLGFAACGDSDRDILGPEVVDSELAAMLATAIEDEYHAENVYLRVLSDFGDIAPFANIVYAEQRHSAAIEQLFRSRSLEAPASDWDLSNVPVFGSVTAACEGAYQAEVRNIEMYDEFLSINLPLDVRTVFQNNRAASEDRHMPAFLSCS